MNDPAPQTPPAPTPTPAPVQPAWVGFVTSNVSGILQALGMVAFASLAWAALGNRVERLETQQTATAQEVERVKTSLREAQQRAEARFTELDRQREEHGRALVELRTRLEGINTTLDKVDKSVALLLDRLGPSGGAYRGQASSDIR